jgi:hypothetical protein
LAAGCRPPAAAGSPSPNGRRVASPAPCTHTPAHAHPHACPPPPHQVPNVMEFADWVGRTKQKHVHVTGEQPLGGGRGANSPEAAVPHAHRSVTAA